MDISKSDVWKRASGRLTGKIPHGKDGETMSEYINRKRRESKLANMTPKDMREWNEQTTRTRGISKLKYTDIRPTGCDDDDTILLDRNDPDHV